jgi:tetratricopeptide (TPR) repeat protein
LLALRAAGSLVDPRFVEPLLLLPERIQQKGYAPAETELAAKIVEASEPDEPRLEVLPAWARSPHPTHTGGMVVDAAQEALVRIGDRGVPGLVEASVLASPNVRVLAARLLHALGRPTVRTQLAIADREARLHLIEVYGIIASIEAVSSLAELVSGSDAEARKAAITALSRIGPPAVGPLVDALGTSDQETRSAIAGVLEAIGPRGRPALIASAARYGLRVRASESVASIASQLADRLTEAAVARWTTEIVRGLELGSSGRYDEAFRVLDAAYAAQPKLYMSWAEPIARLYLRRARSLFTTGNYDAAIEALRLGQGVRALDEAAALQESAELMLARGYLEVDELDKAEEALAAVDAANKPDTAAPGLVGASFAPIALGQKKPSPELRALRASLFVRRAQLALKSGDYGRARAMVVRARSLAPEVKGLIDVERRLLMFENLAILVVFGLTLPVVALTLIVALRRRANAARMERLASAIDRDPARR